MKGKKILLLSILFLLFLIAGIALGVLFNKSITQQFNKLSNLGPTPTTIREEGTCTTPNECRTMYADNVVNAVAAIRKQEDDPTLEVTAQGETLKEEVTIYCSEDNKCWEYNNITKEVSEVNE